MSRISFSQAGGGAMFDPAAYERIRSLRASAQARRELRRAQADTERAQRQSEIDRIIQQHVPVTTTHIKPPELPIVPPALPVIPEPAPMPILTPELPIAPIPPPDTKPRGKIVTAADLIKPYDWRQSYVPSIRIGPGTTKEQVMATAAARYSILQSRAVPEKSRRSMSYRTTSIRR